MRDEMVDFPKFGHIYDGKVATLNKEAPGLQHSICIYFVLWEPKSCPASDC